MVSQMHGFQAFCIPIKELLRHVLVIYLVDNYIEFVALSQYTHFKLASPSSIFSDDSNILVDVHIVLNKELALLLVGLQVIDNLLAQRKVLVLEAI